MTGRDPKNYTLAKEIETRVGKIPGAADVHLHQLVHGPDLRVNVDRTRAEQLGLSQRDVAGTVLTSLLNTSIVPSGEMQPQLLGNLATLERSESPVIVNHYNVNRLRHSRNFRGAFRRGGGRRKGSR
jgi:Cu/Ag efflux pump CusA